MPAIIVGGKPCRFCRRIIPASAADLLGTPYAGYTCVECYFDGRDSFADLCDELETANQKVEPDAPGRPLPCMMGGYDCLKSNFTHGYIVRLDGNKRGVICGKCFERYQKLRRETFGPGGARARGLI